MATTKWMEVQGQKRADADDSSNFWNPKPGDRIVGRYQGWRPNKKYPNSKTHSVKLTNGTVQDINGSTVLDDKLEKVPNNAHVAIQYRGQERSSKGKDYYNYRVFILEAEDQPVATEEIPVIEDDEPGEVNIKDIPF